MRNGSDEPLTASSVGDKICLNRDKRKILKEKGIQILRRQLGRPPKNTSEEQIERERIGISLRNEAEAQFGPGKRVYRANNIRAKLPNTAQCWTAMCYFVKNLAKFMKELCLVLMERWARRYHLHSKFKNLSSGESKNAISYLLFGMFDISSLLNSSHVY